MSQVQHVVIADPDPRERARAAELLRQPVEALGMSVQVHHASDGQVALALIEQLRPILVVSEVLLEGMSGLAILRRLKNTLPEGQVPPFLFVTAMARESDRYWGLRNGAHGYVMKPYEEELLVSRIRDILRPGGTAVPEKLGLL